MNHHPGDDALIQRHLDGETSTEEVAHVTRLLAENASFRSRFFGFVNQVARLRELLGPPAGAAPDRRSSTMTAVLNPPAPLVAAPAESLGMRIDVRQIYFNAILGGSGGLLGWFLIALLGSLAWFANLNVYWRDVVIGPVLGICIGFAIGSTEGLIASRSLRRIARGGLYGLILGAIGGLIGLPLGEYIFNLKGGGVWPRAIGWAVFGAFVGTSDGFAQRMPGKICYGVLGGLLGGLLGGSSYEGLIQYVRTANNRNQALAWGGAIGLIVLGACIGALVGLVESLLRKAWVRFTLGRLEGQTRTLDSRRPHTIGSSPACSIVIPNDQTLAPIHAEIAFDKEDFVVRARDGAVSVRRHGHDSDVQRHVLQPGDSIRVGGSRLVFYNEEKKP